MAGPVDWTRGAGRPSATRPRAVDIIIPVYGAPEELSACLVSVAAHTDLSKHRVILIADGPQNAAVERVLTQFSEAHATCVIMRNDQRLGFVGSVNRGMGQSGTDVILLNSDTVVTPRWVEKLVEAAYSSGDVATVTPLSNHATLCSIPRSFEENLLPDGMSAADVSDLVERVSVRTYPRLPTGVGVCLYIRRAALDDVGFFDESRFGLGYGEENDFCMRALRRGWVHVADDATFIEHAGHASFGASRASLQRKARRALEDAHPRYASTIAEFMKRDPMRDVRIRIQTALGLLPKSGRRIVHLVHGWPPFQHAGTELYAAWLVRQQAERAHVAVYTRGADMARADGEAVELLDGGVRVRLLTNHFTARDPVRRNAIADRRLDFDFERFLREEQPDLLHVHHLAGHAFSLMRVARRLGIPIVLQLQDWWFLCARVNLLDANGNRCSGPALAKCSSCATLTRIPPLVVTNRAMHVLRRLRAKRAVSLANAFVAGSNAIRADYERAGFIPGSTPFHVIPYGIDLSRPSGVRSPRARPVRFGYVGSILPHKGVHTAVEAMRGFSAAEASFHVWGDATASPEYVDGLRRMAGDAVIFEGTFREEEKPRVFESMDVLLVPSIGLESFGLAAREAMTCGVPVVATEGAALSEMFGRGTCGDFFAPGDAGALRAILRRIVDDPSVIERWAAALPVPKHSDAHALEIERVYDSVLKTRTT
jgi:glycosyltransferase involved in cell wall biosynthesis/GT2 family glycosyltransferase